MLEIILYVRDQEVSRNFYAKLLNQEPHNHVIGMTEFRLSADLLLGLMPENGIAGIITPSLPHPSGASGIPRCELYLNVEDPDAWNERALKNGATFISKGKSRDWGDFVAYCADPDGHVLAFARKADK